VSAHSRYTPSSDHDDLRTLTSYSSNNARACAQQQRPDPLLCLPARALMVALRTPEDSVISHTMPTYGQKYPRCATRDRTPLNPAVLWSAQRSPGFPVSGLARCPRHVGEMSMACSLLGPGLRKTRMSGPLPTDGSAGAMGWHRTRACLGTKGLVGDHTERYEYLRWDFSAILSEYRRVVAHF
jgi:hypothetical protein